MRLAMLLLHALSPDCTPKWSKLDFSTYQDRNEVIDRARKAGVSAMIITGAITCLVMYALETYCCPTHSKTLCRKGLVAVTLPVWGGWTHARKLDKGFANFKGSEMSIYPPHVVT